VTAGLFVAARLTPAGSSLAATITMAGTAGLFVAARLTPAGPSSLRDNVQVRCAYLSNLEVLILPSLTPGVIACGDV